ncbi:SH2 domain-containing protein A-like isoform X1 [Oryza glaberrima]|uniref:SH2 domain-containing protein n=1 Tax=Oryza glaberrima TaxID=4538 RepID=I1QW31_ORYGL|nr:SH2 domain-containing protein A-like isoform X1 [Oryza glaberrima]
MAAPPGRGGADGYCDLPDVRLELDPGKVRGGGGGFTVCFWLYLSSSARPSSVILHQVAEGGGDKVPFLALGEGNKLILFPLLGFHREAPTPDSSYPWTDITNLTEVNECPLDNWFHVGCEVTENIMRLHIDCDLVAETHLHSLYNEPDYQDDANQINLLGSKDKLEGYVYNMELSCMLGNIQQQFAKNPPFKLSIDYSCSDGIEEGDDGIWNIVGGKASCRRNFILEVILVDAFGEAAKDREIVASLVYADNGALVEKSRDDSEPPLLISCDGIEYPAVSRPLPIIRGRALFKLKISQLSSKCDNKLFRIFFSTLGMKRYPFLEAYSKPIRCISRNRTSRPLGSAKRIGSASMDDIQSINNCEGFGHSGKANGRLQTHDPSSVVCFHPSKFSKIEDDVQKTSSQNKHAKKMVLDKGAQDVMVSDSTASDYDSMDAGSSWSLSDGDDVESFSDAEIFRYCLDGTHERSKFLRAAAPSVNEDDLIKLANQVSLYSGCTHHRNQILISKQLLQEGADIWSIISKNNERALWSSAVPEMKAKFLEIVHPSNRGLSEQDFEVLRGIAGCGDDIGRDEFDKLWSWLYPVAIALSKDKINRLWDFTAHRWIEGLITLQETENALRSSRDRLMKPGTFVLRFPTTRSWPHPDAGSLVVTYVGSDNSIHHRLLSLDVSDAKSGNLEDLLLKEPELSQLGRVDRLPSSMQS